jgi:hypothetical protein
MQGRFMIFSLKKKLVAMANSFADVHRSRHWNFVKFKPQTCIDVETVLSEETTNAVLVDCAQSSAERNITPLN